MSGSPALGERERGAILHAVYATWPRARAIGLDPLAGDASMRRYVRIRIEGASASSCIAMLLPEGEAATRSEEPTTGDDTPEELPFLDVQRVLARAGVPVPAVLRAEIAASLLLLEDVGDHPLAEVALALGDEPRGASRRPLFEEAVDVLAAIAALVRKPDRSSIAFRRRFDRALIGRELDIVSSHGLATGDQPRDPASDPELARALAGLGDDLAAQPEVLMHRDYHAWNLHVDESGRLRVIDFQDAMLGPALHDLASLCTDRDSDRFVTPALEAHLVQHFRQSLLRRGGPELASDRVHRDYFTAAAFRTLRVIGRFRFLALERGVTGYLRFLPRMARQTKRALEGRGDRALLALLAERSEMFA
jgi:aminoglycoside/choline kinase family phosphotransferase